MYLVEAYDLASPTQLAAHERRKKLRSNLAIRAMLEKPMPVIQETNIAPIAPSSHQEPELKPPAKAELPVHVAGSARSVVTVVVFACADAFNIEFTDILSARRTAQIVKGRQAAFYIIKCLTTWSLPEIGRRLKRDHTTVLHGLRKVQRHIQSDPCYATQLEEIKARVRDTLNANKVHPVAGFSGERQCGLPEQQGEGPGPDSIA